MNYQSVRILLRRLAKSLHSLNKSGARIEDRPGAFCGQSSGRPLAFNLTMNSTANKDYEQLNLLDGGTRILRVIHGRDARATFSNYDTTQILRAGR